MKQFTNAKARSRFARIVVSCLAVILVIAAVPTVIYQSALTAKAVDVNSEAALRTQLSGSGTVSIRLTGNILITAHDFRNRYTTATGETKFTIPSGKTVNLNLNGYHIEWIPPEDSNKWKNIQETSGYTGRGPDFILIQNNGTLNVTNSSSAESRLNLSFVADGMELGSKGKVYCGTGYTIFNTGTLSVGTNVKLISYINHKNTSFKTGRYSDQIIKTVGIYQTTGSCNFAGRIDTNSTSQSCYTGYAFGSHNSYNASISYGIYAKGGYVICEGNSKRPEIKAHAWARFKETTNEPSSSRIRVMAVGIFTNSSQSRIIGADILPSVYYADTDKSSGSSGNPCKDKNGNQCVVIGIITRSTAATSNPVIGLGTNISPTISRGLWDSGNSAVIETQRAIAYCGNGNPYDPYVDNNDVCGNCDLTAGTMLLRLQSQAAGTTLYYRDENGTSQTANTSNRFMVGNMLVGGNWTTPNATTASKYVYLYRYYNTSGTFIKSYFLPGGGSSDDGYAYYNSAVTMTGNTAAKTLSTTQTLKYSSGAAPTNPNFYELDKISYYAFDGTAGRPADWETAAGTVIKQGTTNNATPTFTAGKNIYVYINLKQRPADSTRMNLSAQASDNPLTDYTLPYLGRAVTPKDINFHIFATNRTSNIRSDDIDITSRYKYNGYSLTNPSQTSSAEFSVTFKYGTTQGSYPTTGLPTNAGTYYVQATIPADTTYIKTPTSYKGYNCAGSTFTFTIIINKVQPTLTKDAATITYGTAVGSISTTDATLTYSNPTFGVSLPVPLSNGSFTWKTMGNEPAAGLYPAAGAHTFKLVWTPNATAAVNFLTSTEINVPVTVNKAALTIAATQKNHTYGDSFTPSVTDFTFSGIKTAAGDSNASIWAQVSDSIRFYAPAAPNTALTFDPGFNVGTYSWKVNLTTLDNYNVTSNAASFIVNQRWLNAEAYSDGKIYDGNANVVVQFRNFTNNYVLDAWPSDFTIAPQTMQASSAAAGTRTVTLPTDEELSLLLTGTKAANYKVHITNGPTISVVISKKAPIVADPAGRSSVYDSTFTLDDHFDHEFATSRTGETPGVWVWEDGNIVPIVNNTGYRAIFIPNDTVNFENKTVTVPVAISKRPITVSAEGNAITYGEGLPAINLVFDGFTSDEEKLVAEGTTITNLSVSGLGGTFPTIDISYSVGDDAGSYPITITQAMTADNYSFVSDSTSRVVVNKAKLFVTARDASVVYGDPAPLYTASYSGFRLNDNAATAMSGTPGFTCSYLPGSPVTASGYPITPTIGSLTSTNYEFVFVAGTLTVTKAPLVAKADNLSIRYNDPVPTLTYSFTGLKAGDTMANAATGAPALTTTYTRGSDVGTYDIEITLGTLSSQNYTITVANGLITVDQALCEVTTWPTTRRIYYSQTLADAVISTDGAARLSDGTVVTGVWQFHNGANYSPSLDNSDVTLYDFEFVPTNDNIRTASTQLTVHVDKKPIEGTPIISGSLMVGDGNRVFADLSAMSPNSIGQYTFQWIIDSNVVSTSSYYEIQTSDEGKYITLTVTAKPNVPYVGSASTTSDSTIAPPLATPTADMLSFVINNYIYDKTPKSVSVTANTAGVGVIKVRYNNSEIAPVKAGSYRITVDIGLGTSYGPVSGLFLGTMQIGKAPLEVSFDINDKVYDAKVTAQRNTAVPITTTGIFAGDDVSVNTSAATFFFETSDVGNDKLVNIRGAILEGVDKGNYEIVIDDTVTANITPKTLTTRAMPVVRDYVPGNTTVDVEFTSLVGILSADRGFVRIANGVGTLASANADRDAAITNVSFDLLGARAGNYVVTITNVEGLTTTINKASPLTIAGFTVPSVAAREYNNDTLADVALISGWSWNNSNERVTVGNTGYLATYTPADTDNYKSVSYNLPITVTKKQLTITFDSHEIIYGEPSPIPTFVATGFARGESIANFGGSVATISTYSQYSPVGTYEVRHSTSSTLYNTNYIINYIPGSIEVGRRQITATYSAINRVYIEGNNTVSVAFTMNNACKARSNDDVYLNTYHTTGTMVDENAGTGKTVSFTLPVLAGSGAGNYILVLPSTPLTVDIEKALPFGYAFPSSATIEYGKPLSQAVFSDPGIGNGTFIYRNGSSYPATTGYFPTTYDCVFTPANTNYKSVIRKVPLTVTICVLNPTVAISGSLYADQTLSAIINGADSNAKNYVHYSWFRHQTNGSVISVGEDAPTYALTADDVGCQISLKIVFDSPYDGEAEFITAKTVLQENLTFWQKIWKWWNRIFMAIKNLLGGVGGRR